MITKVIFVVALIMPNGEYQTKSSVVDACPSIKMVGDHYQQRIRNGEIRDWNATCFVMNFEKGFHLMLNLLIGPITQLAGTWLEGKVEKTKANAAQVAEAQSRATIAEKKPLATSTGNRQPSRTRQRAGRTSLHLWS